MSSNLFIFNNREFTKQVSDVTPARRAALKAQKVTKPKKETLEEIIINEQVETPLVKTPEVLKQDEGAASIKRKRDTPVSTRSTRSKLAKMDKTSTPMSTRSTRSIRSTKSSKVVQDNLDDFFQDEENEENVIEENVIQDADEEDTTWFTRIWNGVMSTVFFV